MSKDICPRMYHSESRFEVNMVRMVLLLLILRTTKMGQLANKPSSAAGIVWCFSKTDVPYVGDQ